MTKLKDPNEIYKTNHGRLIEKISNLRVKKSNELVSDNIPTWQAKLMSKHRFWSKIFGYKVMITPLPTFESDIIREKLTLFRRKEEIASIEFRASDRRKLK